QPVRRSRRSRRLPVRPAARGRSGIPTRHCRRADSGRRSRRGDQRSPAPRRRAQEGSAMRILLTLLLLLSATLAAAQTAPLPRIETSAGRHALIVDGRPFLMLGAQVNNSSNYPAMLPEIWPTIRALHANTVEVPVAWEQIEPVEGRFDFSFLDTLLREAREN